MPENLDLEQKPPDTKVKARQEIYRDVLHLLKLEVQKHRKMLATLHSRTGPFLKNHLKDMEALLNRILFIEPKP